jgi:transcriptional regulator with XRE-family HTH domain
MDLTDPFASEDLTEEEMHSRDLVREDFDMLDALVDLRRRNGLTQEQVALKMGRDKSAACRFERLDSDPRLSTIRRYARAIGAFVEHRVSVWQSVPTAIDSSPTTADSANVVWSMTALDISGHAEQWMAVAPHITGLWAATNRVLDLDDVPVPLQAAKAYAE